MSLIFLDKLTHRAECLDVLNVTVLPQWLLVVLGWRLFSSFVHGFTKFLVKELYWIKPFDDVGTDRDLLGNNDLGFFGNDGLLNRFFL
jgi:hypothetical protein